MSASPFLSHVPNAVTPFSYNLQKVHTLSISSIPSKFSFTIFSNPPTNNCSVSTKIEGRSTEFERQDDYNSKSSEPISHSGPAIKAPTAPWMNEPLLVKPNEILEFKRRKTKKDSTFGGNEENPDMDLTGKVGGGRGKVAMKKIFKGIDKLQETRTSEQTLQNPENVKFKFSPGDLWGNGDYRNDAKLEDNSGVAKMFLENNEFDIPLAEVENEGKLKKLPWQRDETTVVVKRVKKEKVVTAAELRLDGILLEKLRDEAANIKKWVKVKKAGVTQDVVDQIHLIWRDNELALVKFDLPLCRNMDRAREIVEMKTRGLVVWSNKDFLAVYRGCNYLSTSKRIWKRNHNNAYSDKENSSFITNYQNTRDGLDEGLHNEEGKWGSLHTPSLYEREGDRLLDGLGPRFVDWWMSKPLPVDADLLPEVVPGFTTPFRLCPPYTKSKLTDAELTHLRKLARPLPTHFVLGRNRNLQGLAAAIIKLWERSHIAKIAIKWGAPNTDNEQMANELKTLTGGVLILRNKFLILLYRGNDFIPSQVAHVVSEREMELTKCQIREESARLKASESFSITTDEHLVNSGIVGTLSEFHCIQSKTSVDLKNEKTEEEIKLGVEQERLEKELKDQERKLYILKKKIEKSARVLEKLKNASRFSEKDEDVEIISEEERVCLREIGLKIDSTLVLGRRGVYDGVVEGMHQHWKHREIVKVITMQKMFSQVMFTAKCLEAESGGIVVSIDKLKEGHAIIVYRGKNYKRPKFAPRNLLNKREALSRSLEIQRIGSMKFFAREKEQAICELKRKLAELSDKKN